MTDAARHGAGDGWGDGWGDAADGAGRGVLLVCFRWAGFDLALPARLVAGLDADPAPAAGAASDVPDIGALLGMHPLPAPAPVRTRLLRLRGADPARRVRVAEPLYQLRVGAVQPVPTLLAARLRLRGLRALVFTPAPTRLLLLVGIPPAD